LLLDGEPAPAEPLCPEPEPPVQVQTAADLADGGFHELEILGIAEPAREPVYDRLGTGPLPQARGQQGAQAGFFGQSAAEPGEVLSSETLDERTGGSRIWRDAGRPVVAGCHHDNVVRGQAVIAVSGNPPTWAMRAGSARAADGGELVARRMLG